MLYGHHACVGKDLLREVVDQLPIDEAIDTVVDDALHLQPQGPMSRQAGLACKQFHNPVLRIMDEPRVNIAS